MCWGYFQIFCFEVYFYIFIGDDWNGVVGNWNNGEFFVQVLIVWIIWVNINGGVVENCFGMGGSNGYLFVFCICNFVVYMEEFGVYFFVDYFFVGYSGQCFWILVDYVDIVVDFFFFEQVNEYIDY